MARNLIAVVLGLMIPLMGMASVEDDATSLSYISYLERYATIQPASEEATIEAAINMPLVSGDRIDTAREARVEAILADGSYLWLDEYTSVSLDSVAFSRDTRGDRTVVFLADGSLMIELLPDVARANRTRVDGGSETIYLEEAGVYRVEVLQGGGLWVEVWQGLAEASTTVGGVVLRPGSGSELSGGRVSAVQARLTDRDDFARWVESRRRIGIGESAQYVDSRYGREASQLDSYGSWVYLSSSQTWAWQPTVSADWRPYTSGRWYWTVTGWCWQSYEPWGWLPYHYGSWWHSPAHGWVWGWGRTWSPAWVYWSYSPGWVGWCPMGLYSSWWRGSGWGWGGHGGGYYPPHGGGRGQARPPRGNVVPRGADGGSAHIRTGRAVAAGDLMLDIEGRTRTSSLRGGGWSVVPERDFSSPRVARVVRSGSDVFGAESGRAGSAVVTSRPLRTERPGRAAPAGEFNRVFREVEGRSDTDVSRVLARDRGLSREEALAGATPRTGGTMVARSSRAVEPGEETGRTTNSRRSGASSLSRTLSTDPSSRAFARPTAPNYFRPSAVYRGSGVGSSGSPSATSGGRTSAPSRSGGATAPPSGRNLAPAAGSRAPDVGRAAPNTGSRTPSSSPSADRPGARRSSGTSSAGSSSARAPVVIPRSSRPAPSRPSATSSRATPSRPSVAAPRTSSPRSGTRSAPKTSSPSRSNSSARSSSGSSRSSPSAKSSSGGSRSSSSGRSSAPSRSSGSAKRR